MKYEWKDGAYRCTQIKDRNGNYITVEYTSDGRLEKITDTLGREIFVTYDGDNYPSVIRQYWKDNNGVGTGQSWHSWATLTYINMDGASGRPSFDTNFSTVTPIGPPDGTALKVLEKITYADGSSTKFDYNTYAQVYKVSNIAADSGTHVLNSTEINIGSPSNPTDCPRFTSTSTTVENFNSGNPVTVTNTAPATATNYSLTGSISINSSVVKVAVTNHPNQLYSRIHFGASGWKEGLTLATEDCTDTGDTCTTRKRWTWTDFTQDNTGLSYTLNPRVIESQVGDGTNTKRTTISYRYDSATSSYLYGLPETVTVGDPSTVLKTQTTTYNLSSDYTSRRIIGLPSETKLWEGTSSGTLMSKITFGYDDEGYAGTGQSLTNATKHCTSTSADCPTAYGTGFSHRGNQTSVKRWDATSPASEPAAVQSTVVYNIAGSPISKTTPWNGTNTRTVSIGYTDAWNDNPNPNRTTYAYPTSITDPNLQSSTVKYRYDIGANVEATSPAPHNQTHGKTTKRIFDTHGRLEKDSVYVNTTETSYTRYEYPTNGLQSKVYSTLVDVDGNGNFAEDEALTETFFDGAGRPLRTRTPHPGSTGLWSATKTEYDILGRVTGQTVPTEVSVSGSTWTVAGDDSAGYKWTYQKYDWMNRVVRKINTDGIDQTTLNDSDVTISYAGCGCAGGLETTIEGENIIERDWAGTTTTATRGRRKQKVYEDILGRTIKTETFKWGGTDVYSKTEIDYNGRDQAVNVEVTDLNDAQNPVTQTTTMSYDGHGRLASRHLPQQNTSTATVYNYNPDDSILSVTDARQAVTSYEYNSRGLPIGISWTVPGQSGIADPADVTFSYDNLGNRTQMTDGLGTVAYEYDSLSRMTAETRDFTDTFSVPPAPTDQLFRLEYTYHVGGGLKSIKDPYGQQINYSNDKAGRLTKVEGSASFGGITTYAENPHYRAWGGLQSLEYGNDTSMSVTFNSRLQADGYDLVKTGQSTPILSKDYHFYSDGAIRKIDDLVNNKFDQIRTYDNVGRVKTASTSFTARGDTPGESDIYNIPFVQSYTFNAFGNLTERQHAHWVTNNFSYTQSFTNNRLTTGLFNLFDADGRQTKIQENSDIIESSYDAAGHLSLHRRSFAPAGEREVKRHYTGDGREGKRETRNYVEVEEDEWEWEAWSNEYFIRSTVLGGEVVSNVSADGSKARTYVRAAGAELAWQQGTGSGASVSFQHYDPAGSSYRTTYITNYTGAYHEGGPAELDPMGTNVGTENYYLQQVQGDYCVGCEQINTEMPHYMFGQPMTVTRDGMAVNWTVFRSLTDGHMFDQLYSQAWRSVTEVGRWYRRTTTPSGPNQMPEGSPIQVGSDSGWALRGVFYSTDWHFSSALTSVEPDVPRGAGGSGGGQTRNEPASAPDSEDMARCLRETFGPGLDLRSVAKTDGSSGIFNFTYKGNPFTVTIYGSRSTSYELGRLYAKETGGSNTPQSGYTSGSQQGNSIESDVADEIGSGVERGKYSAIGFLALIYHEVGNGVGVYLNKNAKGKKIGSGWTEPSGDNDSDAGTAFERCLFGGIVSLPSGNLGNKRYFYGY